MKILLTFLVLLVSSTCLADPSFNAFDAYLRDQQAQAKFGGVASAKPAKPVKAKPASKTPVETTTTNVLDCGVTIKVGSLRHYNELNKLCSDVVSKYRTSFPEYPLPAKVNVPVSFLPSNVLIQYFGLLVAGSDKLVRLDGFTDISSSGIPESFYVLSNWATFFYFKTVFAHELYHVLNALSHHEDSEDDAAAFTKNMGLGI